MKLKTPLFAIASLMLLASCGEQQSGSVPPASQAESSIAQPTYIDFVAMGKIYFDVPEALDVKISYGSTEVKAAQTADIGANLAFSYTGESTSTHSFVVVTSDGEGNELVAVNKAIVADKLGEYLSSVLTGVVSTSKKAYVAFATGDAVKWTRGLNARLDEAIGRYNI